MTDLVQIKQERDIKSEPEDEIDTLEYEQPLNQLDEKFTVKVEKIDPDDNKGEVDEARVLFDHIDDSGFNATNRNVRMQTKPVDNDQLCSSHMETHSNETSEATTFREGSNVDGMKTLTNVKLTKSSKKSRSKRSAPSAQKKQHKCSICGFVVAFLSHLETHMRKHTGEKPFPCTNCDRRFSLKHHLQRHMKVHVNKDLPHCPSCWQVFATKKENLNHESVCKRRRYECFLCRTYSTPFFTILKRHMRTHSGVRPFRCAQCSMKFIQKSDWKRHLKTKSHQPKYRCSVCTRNFSKQSEKDTHEVKCNRRRYECYLCRSYTTYKKQSLQYHMRMHHTGEKSFRCNLCAKCYAMESDLKHHIKSGHKQ